MRAIRKVLIIRFRRIGDAVISTVLCSSLKKTFPEAEIHYVLNQSIAPLFKNHPDIDSVITFSDEEMQHFSLYLKKVKEIVRTEKYDIIIDLRSTLKTLWFSFFSMSTPYRIGKKKHYNFLLNNYRIDNCFRGTNDEVNKTLELLQPLQKNYPLIYDPHFRLYVDDEERFTFRHCMQEKGIDFTKPVVVCAVSARLSHKVWNRENMKVVLRKIIEKYNAQLIFNFGGKTEEEFARQLHREMDNHPNIFTTIEASNLRELASLFANADFFFGNEGGPRHISQAFDVPSFAIYPPETSKKEWLPNASNRFQGIELSDVSPDPKYGLSFTEKFDLITAEAVWERVDPMLELLIRTKKE